MNWDRHFSQFGVDFGVTTPADILGYRRAWDPYVTGTLRILNGCADALDATSDSPPSGFSSADLKGLAASYRDTVNKTLAEWNQFSGLQPEEMMFQGSVILQAFQNTVKGIGKLREDPQLKVYCPSSNWPLPPTPEEQQAVINSLEGAGIIAQGVLDIMAQSEGDGLQVIATQTGKAAGTILKGAAQGITEGAKAIMPWWGWAGLGLVGFLLFKTAFRVSPIGKFI